MLEIPFPKTDEGYIDESEIIKIAYSKLKLPYGTLDIITPWELATMYMGHEENERDRLESTYNVIRVGVASAMSGKNIKLFDDKGKKGNSGLPKGEITQEERTNTLDKLDKLFN